MVSKLFSTLKVDFKFKPNSYPVNFGVQSFKSFPLNNDIQFSVELELFDEQDCKKKNTIILKQWVLMKYIVFQ